MRGLTISAHGGLDRIEYRTDLPKPEPKRGEIRVRVRAAALNHLDLFVLAGMPGLTMTTVPWVLGADATGIIDAIGDLSGIADNHLKVGDTVIINPGISDYTCEYCMTGEHSLCVHFKLLGEHLPGTLAEYITMQDAAADGSLKDEYAKRMEDLATQLDTYLKDRAATDSALSIGRTVSRSPPSRSCA